MPQFVEKSAKTVKEAVDLALAELNATEDNVEIEVLEEGTKGIFGLIGSKLARVKVTLKETGGEKAKKFLLDIFSKMKVSADVLVEESEDTILLRIQGDDIGIIIGRRGETLDALQYLTSLLLIKASKDIKDLLSTLKITGKRERRPW